MTVNVSIVPCRDYSPEALTRLSGRPWSRSGAWTG